MWQQISNNPLFQSSAFGSYMTEDRYNALDQNTKDFLARTYINNGAPVPTVKPEPEVTPEHR